MAVPKAPPPMLRAVPDIRAAREELGVPVSIDRTPPAA